MIASKPIIKELYQGKDIQFVHLCMNTDEEASDKFVATYDIPGIHIKLEGEDVKRIMSNFNNSGFPFQIIVNKEGKVIRKGNDLRLTMPATKSLIGALLKVE